MVLELFVSSNRPGTIGEQDLWTSTRPTIFDAWSEPVNMGVSMNTAFSDFTPEVSRDGRELYFASNRPGGEGAFDLYVSRRPARR
jgi:OmpA-OmpF porin, OOP family